MMCVMCLKLLKPRVSWMPAALIGKCNGNHSNSSQFPIPQHSSWWCMIIYVCILFFFNHILCWVIKCKPLITECLTQSLDSLAAKEKAIWMHAGLIWMFAGRTSYKCFIRGIRHSASPLKQSTGLSKKGRSILFSISFSQTCWQFSNLLL